MITSVANRSIKAVRRLGKRPWRERRGLLLCEGHRALRAALEAGAPVQQVLHLKGAVRHRADLLERAERTGAEMLTVSPGVMRHLTSLESPPDILSVVVRREATLDEQVCEPAVVVLSQVRDPAAAGGILATALATGCNGAVACRGSVDPYDRKAIRAAGGAQMQLAVVRDVSEKDAIERHRADGVTVVALSARGKPIQDAVLPERVLFVIEGEGAADDDAVATLADEQACAPSGVSIASGAAMMLYEWMRRRGT